MGKIQVAYNTGLDFYSNSRGSLPDGYWDLPSKALFFWNYRSVPPSREQHNPASNRRATPYWGHHTLTDVQYIAHHGPLLHNGTTVPTANNC
ncbi:hypothetical protein NQZ68_009900 [Dissostichus eleginoides]|nr:hypothetical protein NQZ68_009900 [Dissostichus eleginoides]